MVTYIITIKCNKLHLKNKTVSSFIKLFNIIPMYSDIKQKAIIMQ